MQTIETVRVVSPVCDDNKLGYIVINKDDLTDEHKLYEEPKAEPPEAEVKPAAPTAPAAPAWVPT